MKKKEKLFLIISLTVFILAAVAVFVIVKTTGSKGKSKIPLYPENTLGGICLELCDKYDFPFEKYIFSEESHPRPEDILTRENLSFALSGAIQNSGELSLRFIPSSSEILKGSSSVFYENLYGNISVNDPETYEGKLIVRNMKEAEKTASECLCFGENKIVFFDFYRDNQDILNLFDDTDKISPEFAENVRYCLSLGLLPYSLSEECYGLLFKPELPVSVSEKEKVFDILSGTLLPDYPDSVLLDGSGKEFSLPGGDALHTYLRFSSIPLIYTVKKILPFLGPTDSLNFYTDYDLAEFYFLVNSEYFGTFSLPLKYCLSSPLTFIFSPADLSDPSEKLNIISELFPSLMKDNFIINCRNALPSGSFDIFGLSFSFFQRSDEVILYIGTIYEKG